MVSVKSSNNEQTIDQVRSGAETWGHGDGSPEI